LGCRDCEQNKSLLGELTANVAGKEPVRESRDLDLRGRLRRTGSQLNTDLFKLCSVFYFVTVPFQAEDVTHCVQIYTWNCEWHVKGKVVPVHYAMKAY
jgi:hypothetical protein